MGLYVVPTPIGNLGDLTVRALAVLRGVDLILAEDTRRTGRLLAHYQIETSQTSFHAFNEHRRVSGLVERILAGQQLALVSDAGTPGVSDPCYLLVTACIRAQVPVHCLPGATAFLPALVHSGFPMQRFVFEGFLPIRKGRKKRLLALSTEERTVVLYESPHRLVRTLEDLCGTMGKDRLACVSRELTKKYEEDRRGRLDVLIAYFRETKPRGEFVITLCGTPKDSNSSRET